MKEKRRIKPIKWLFCFTILFGPVVRLLLESLGFSIYQNKVVLFVHIVIWLLQGLSYILTFILVRRSCYEEELKPAELTRRIVILTTGFWLSVYVTHIIPYNH